MIDKHELTDGWTVRAVAGEVPAPIALSGMPARVPGSVHLDLIAAGVLADPLLDLNESAAQWPGSVDWRYETMFDAPADAHGGPVDLVALGLDTVARVEVNGVVVAQTANMHRSYRIAIGDVLLPGRNSLAVTFTAPFTAARAAEQALGPRPRTVAEPMNAIRKMACNFGADWGPRLVTAGIWRSIGVEVWREARLVQVRPVARLDGRDGVVRVQVGVERDPATAAGPMRVTVAVGDVTASAVLGAGEDTATIDVRVPDVRLWWPAGYGDQPLYDVRVDLVGGDGRALDEWRGRVGFRTVTLDTEPDDRGTSFRLCVNGEPVFARGASWIPDDPFPARVTRERYRTRLHEARSANINLVRVWGGGIYEDDEFYDACDELGVLVWQDFMFSCACYAEEEPLRAEVEAEVREVVGRLCPHPSIALWCGGNEILWGLEDWGWKQPLQHRSWGLGYFAELMPALVAELDPGRPYIPGTPYSPAPDRHPNDPGHGTMHIWDVWNQRDYTAYREYVPRFAAEFGFQGPAAISTLHRAVAARPLSLDSVALHAHETAIDGFGKLDRGLRSHIRRPEGFDDWHWATSLNQARAVALAVEHFRSYTPTCMGTILWQLNDCWPAISWAVLDSDGRRKPAWYALRQAYRDRLLTLQPRNGGLALVAVNDTAAPWCDIVEVTRRDVDGTVLAAVEVRLDVAPRAAATAALPGAIPAAADPAREVVVAESVDQGPPGRAWWHCAEDVAAELPMPKLASNVTRIDGGYRVDVEAGCFVRDLAVLADRVAPAAVVDEMLLTLLAGETASFTVVTDAEVPVGAFTDPAVLRCANQLSVGT